MSHEPIKTDDSLSNLLKMLKAEGGMPVRPFENLDANIEDAGALINVIKHKVKMAAILPVYFQNDEIMQDIFTPADIAKLKKLCDGYTRHKSESQAIKFSIDYRLLKAIELAYSNQKAMLDVPARTACLPEYLKHFVTSFCDVCTIIQVRLKTSASMEINQASIRPAYYPEHQINPVASLGNEIQEKELSIQSKSERQAIISKYYDRKWQNNLRIQKTVLSANKKMNEICVQSESHLSKLEDEADKIEKTFKGILKENIIAYKKTLEKKHRILAQLVGWIRKYDSDVGERIAENKNLKRELAKCTEELNKFLVKFEEQEALFNAIANSKGAEESIDHENKLMLFIMNRSAKILQRAWRKYYKSKKKQGKAKRKKDKKGKK